MSDETRPTSESPLAPGGVIDNDYDVNFINNPKADVEQKSRRTQSSAELEEISYDPGPSLAPGGYLPPENDLQAKLHNIDKRIVGVLDPLINNKISAVTGERVFNANVISRAEEIILDGGDGINVDSLIKFAKDLGISGISAALEFSAVNIHGLIVDKYLDDININTPNDPYESKPLVSLKELNESNDPKSDSFHFVQKRVSLAGTSPETWIPDTAPSKRTSRSLESILSAASFVNGVVPMGFEQAENSDGSILTRGNQRPVDALTDNDAYVPLSFTDLRPITSRGTEFRTVYFRPIITNLTEDFAPNWSKEDFFGRSDQVAHYISTIRTLFIAFELHAFSRDDVDVMYKKLNWLSSLVYPQYDRELLMKSGPVCRMRVGDVFSSINKLGLPGIIDSINIDYSESLWELDEGSKVPRTIKVSVSFHILHDTIVGRNEEGIFGGIGTVNNEGRFSADDFVQKGTVLTPYFRGFGDVSAKTEGGTDGNTPSPPGEGLPLNEEDF